MICIRPFLILESCCRKANERNVLEGNERTKNEGCNSSRRVWDKDQ